MRHDNTINSEIQAAETRQDKDIPLVVDLDGTLIKSDCLLESFYALLRKEPLSIFSVPLWILQGRGTLKSRIAQNVNIDERTLPYQEEFLAFLRAEHSKGRTIVLATASARKFAERIAGHLGVFTGCIASDEGVNLKGKAKLKALLGRYGDKGFDYAGNDVPDLGIFPHARKVIVVNASGRVLCNLLRFAEMIKLSL